MQRYIPLPSEPGVLGISDDCQFLYVALTDRVRRIDLTANTSDVDIFLPGLSGAFVSGMLPLPSTPTTVIISQTNGATPGTTVVDGTKPREQSHGMKCLAGTPDGNTIYGSTGGTFQELILNQPLLYFGPQIQVQNLLGGPSCPVLSGGLVYDSAGNIVDPSVPALLGRFGAWGLVRPIPELSQTFFVGTDSDPSPYPFTATLMSFDNATRARVASVPLPVSLNVLTGRLIRWGSDGLGFVALSSTPSGPVPGSQIYLFHAPH
ncbi:MAG TPA: hypothetical protein VH639_08495 [Bryobacteraceae bacterium]